MNVKNTLNEPGACLRKVVFFLVGLIWCQPGHSEIFEKKLNVIAGHETWKIRGGEQIGMSQLGLELELDSKWRVGALTYAATTGDRGGFIVLGGQLERVIRLNQNWAGEAGIYIGGGGGRGGSTLTGGGLMLREHVGLSRSVIKDGSISFGLSRVDFPQSDAIANHQWYLIYRYKFSALGSSGQNGTSSGFGLSIPKDYEFYRHQLAVSYQSVSPIASRTYSGTPQEHFGKLGISWRSYPDTNWFFQVNSSGAMRGDSRGYMDIIPGVGYEYALTGRVRTYGALSIGTGGGGDVDTAGGILVEPALGVQYHFYRGWFLDGSFSRLFAPTGNLTANSLNLKLGYEFNSTDSLNTIVPWEIKTHPLRIRVVDQQYSRGGDNWRTEPERPVRNLGAQIDYFVTPQIFLTGQGLGAYSGGAGAYMVGLIGGGLLRQLDSNLFAQVEALVGAAGGGGMSTGQGAITQLNLGLGLRFSKATSLLASLGRINSVDSNMYVNVAGFSLNYDFKTYSR
jgi:hypothetical protein